MANREIDHEIEVITAECVFGMNIFRDLFAGIRDIFGGRSEASQKVLRDARQTCLHELKLEANELGADAIIGIDLDYQEFSGKGKGMQGLLKTKCLPRIPRTFIQATWAFSEDRICQLNQR